MRCWCRCSASSWRLRGSSQLLRTIDLVRGGLNPQLEIQGVVLTMYDKRNKLSDQVASEVAASSASKVYQTVIPRNVRLSEAPSFGKPALIYDHKCSGSQAYLRLAKEVVQRERQRTCRVNQNCETDAVGPWPVGANRARCRRRNAMNSGKVRPSAPTDVDEIGTIEIEPRPHCA